MERILITGSNRGLGLELVRQYALRGDARVFATCRSPDAARDLRTLASAHPDRVTLVALDVTDPDSLTSSCAEVEARTDGLDLLVNNAGVYLEDSAGSFGSVSPETVLTTLHVNAVAPLMVAQTYVGLLQAGSNPRIVNMSSDAGGLSQKTGNRAYGYCSSKAALNMVTRIMALDLAPDGITTISMHPGWVKTDMGGPDAKISVETSVSGMIEVIDRLSSADNGTFVQWDGKGCPW